MIHVDLPQLRRAADLTEIIEINAQIQQLPQDQISDFIDKHENKCSALRGALWSVGLMKCWYSEALLQQPEGQVEHYRPKRRLSGVRHLGYWWRTFDWTNLRLAHPTVNRRKTDYLTGRRAGKGSYFPLRDNTTRAQGPEGETAEQPTLLDPAVPTDCTLICFAEESGSPQPRYGELQNAWFHQRAVDSIEYYHLAEASWNAKRADLMAAVRKLCDQLEEISCESPRDEIAYHQKIDEIYMYVKPQAEFASACRQILRERGLLEAVL